MRQTGGFVFVDSIPGEGTEFTIMLPRQKPEAALADAGASPASTPLAADLVRHCIVIFLSYRIARVCA